jgi:hypothetical protein
MRVYKFLDSHFGLVNLQQKRLKISTVEDLNDPFELLPYNIQDPSKRKALKDARERWSAAYGLVCFSGGWTDPILWAHYGDKHKGLCLGFEVAPNTVTEVRYVDDRLTLPDVIEDAHGTEWMTTKFSHWAYEREFRSWRTLKNVPKFDGLYFQNFGASLRLVQVIAGARCAITRNQSLDAIGPSAHEVELTKGRAGFGKFEIVVDQRGFLES